MGRERKNGKIIKKWDNYKELEKKERMGKEIKDGIRNKEWDKKERMGNGNRKKKCERNGEWESF